MAASEISAVQAKEEAESKVSGPRENSRTDDSFSRLSIGVSGARGVAKATLEEEDEVHAPFACVMPNREHATVRYRDR